MVLVILTSTHIGPYSRPPMFLRGTMRWRLDKFLNILRYEGPIRQHRHQHGPPAKRYAVPRAPAQLRRSRSTPSFSGDISVTTATVSMATITMVTRRQLPSQCRASAANWKPFGQRHRNEPGVFLQRNAHESMCSRHSSTSASHAKNMRMIVLTEVLCFTAGLVPTQLTMCLIFCISF